MHGVLLLPTRNNGGNEVYGEDITAGAGMFTPDWRMRYALLRKRKFIKNDELSKSHTHHVHGLLSTLNVVSIIYYSLEQWLIHTSVVALLTKPKIDDFRVDFVRVIIQGIILIFICNRLLLAYHSLT